MGNEIETYKNKFEKARPLKELQNISLHFPSLTPTIPRSFSTLHAVKLFHIARSIPCYLSLSFSLFLVPAIPWFCCLSLSLSLSLEIFSLSVFYSCYCILSLDFALLVSRSRYRHRSLTCLLTLFHILIISCFHYHYPIFSLFLIIYWTHYHHPLF